MLRPWRPMSTERSPVWRRSPIPTAGSPGTRSLEAYEILKKNQYGQYLKDVVDGKYIDKLPGHADR